MSTRFRYAQRFDAPVEAVEAAFHHPELIARLSELPDLGRPELLEVAADGHILTRRVRFAFTGRLPRAALSVVDPDRLTWVEDSVLDRRTHQGRIRILPDHYADRLSCEAIVRFEAQDGVTERVTEGELAVRAPFVAGRVERAIVSGLERNAVAEEALVREWLAQPA